MDIPCIDSYKYVILHYMKKFIYLYFGGDTESNTTEEQRNKIMKDWMIYFGKLGNNIVDGGAPFGERKTVGGKDTSATNGYTIISAKDLDEAIALTEGHPHLKSGGSIDVIETIAMQS